MAWNTFVSSGGINSNHFDDYDSALKHYQSVKPIRGREGDQRPLGKNRSAYSHCQIKHDPLLDRVSAVLYNTECVSIHADGIIKISTGSWITPSTAKFIEATLPTKFGRVYLNRKKLIYVKGITPQDRKEYIIPRGGLLLQANSDWTDAELVADQEVLQGSVEYKADRKVMNKLRAGFSAFLSTLDVMGSMSAEYTIQEITEFYPEVVDEYARRRNEFEANKAKEDAEAEARNSRGEDRRYYPRQWQALWEMRGCVENMAGLPRMSGMHDLGNMLKNNKHASWIKNSQDNVVKNLVPKFLSLMSTLHDSEKPDATVIRKAIIGIATNPNAYGHYRGGWGTNGDEHMVEAQGTIASMKVPELFYEQTKETIENYFTDALKYLYADIIFKKVEVPSGVIPKSVNEKYVVVNRFLLENTDSLTSRKVVAV